MKKATILFLVVAGLALSSCVSISVVADYDKQANFNEYKSFAFFKPGIDEAEISDLDKKRILRAIEAELVAKGFTKSENPDILVSIFTKESQRVDVFNNWGWGGAWGWGWGGWWGPWGGFGPGFNNVSTRTVGDLYIDVIDANKKELVWQGKGSGTLRTKSVEKKEERIKQFVNEIMKTYPPSPAMGGR